MSRVTCRCLNVAVHYKGVAWNSRSVEGGKLLPVDSGHRLRNVSVYEVNLDIAGITVEQASLLLAVTLGDWTVKSCSNCGCDVCVSHVEKRRVFVCPGLLTAEEDWSQVKGHPHYSSVFRILLNPNLEEDRPLGRPRVSSMSFGRDDPAMRLVQTQVKEFLAREEEAVEKRIREFQKTEKELFARLKQKTLTQRTLLFAAIAKARDSAGTDCTQSHQSPALPHTLTHSTSLPPPPLTKERVTITLSDARHLPNKPGEDDALFSLDGFDENEMEEVDGGKRGVAFPQSDDEESGTDDSSYRDLSSVQSAIASSVPLGVPTYKPSQELATSHEAAPTDMASSIKALALSVQNTGLFGDLPRPRVSSASHYK